MTTVARRLLVVAQAAWLWGCGPKAINEPPPQTSASFETSPDAGLPALPLTGKGVIVPSDVKLEPPPNDSERAVK